MIRKSKWVALKNLVCHPEFISGSLCTGHKQGLEILKQVQNDEIMRYFKASK